MSALTHDTHAPAQDAIDTHGPIVLRGVLGLCFGAFALALPSLTLRAAIAGFGVYLAADGMAAVGAAIRRRPWSVLWLVEGLLGLGASIFVLFRPELTARALVDLAAFWSVLSGLLEIAAARRLRSEAAVRLLALLGAASLALGLSMFVWPEAATLWIIRGAGAYGVFFGAGMLGLSFWEARAPRA